MKYSFIACCLAFASIMSGCDTEDDIPETTAAEEDCLSTSSVNNGSIIEGEYIVRLSSVTSPAARVNVLTNLLEENHIDAKAMRGDIHAEKEYYAMQLSRAQAETLKASPGIASIEPDRIVSICGCFSVQEPRTITWNVNKVGYGDGTGKTAWIIDTGIESSHPDLNVDKSRSKSFVDGSDYEDDNGHGTHVAGIIGALNNNIGTLGVASGATVVSLKVLDSSGEGKLSSVLNALAYIRSKGSAGDVVNISMGFDDTSEILENEIKSVANRGIYFALAAGNEEGSANAYSPGRTSGKNIFTVSAVDSLNRFAKFSNYGNDVVDFAAPGVRIMSTYKNGKYAILSGTSQAAPHVAGILLINKGKVNSSGLAGSDPDGTPDAIAHK